MHACKCVVYYSFDWLALGHLLSRSNIMQLLHHIAIMSGLVALAMVLTFTSTGLGKQHHSNALTLSTAERSMRGDVHNARCSVLMHAWYCS